MSKGVKKDHKVGFKFDYIMKIFCDMELGCRF